MDVRTEAVIRNGEYFTFGPSGLYVEGRYATTGPYAVKRVRTKCLNREQVDIEALIVEAKGVTEWAQSGETSA